MTLTLKKSYIAITFNQSRKGYVDISVNLRGGVLSEMGGVQPSLETSWCLIGFNPSKLFYPTPYSPVYHQLVYYDQIFVKKSFFYCVKQLEMHFMIIHLSQNGASPALFTKRAFIFVPTFCSCH